MAYCVTDRNGPLSKEVSRPRAYHARLGYHAQQLAAEEMSINENHPRSHGNCRRYLYRSLRRMNNKRFRCIPVSHVPFVVSLQNGVADDDPPEQ